MVEFNNLLAIADKLLGPEGCPWDKEQTFFSLQPYLLEETHELIEAIDLQDGSKIAEELGDVFYALVFVAKLGEKEGSFQLAEALDLVCEKLKRRHPHVFGGVVAKTKEEIIKNWEQIKKNEFKERKSAIDGVPAAMPALARAQKIAHKIGRAEKRKTSVDWESEEELGEALWKILEKADAKGWNAEDVLRRTVAKKEKKFRDSE